MNSTRRRVEEKGDDSCAASKPATASSSTAAAAEGEGDGEGSAGDPALASAPLSAACACACACAFLQMGHSSEVSKLSARMRAARSASDSAASCALRASGDCQ